MDHSKIKHVTVLGLVMDHNQNLTATDTKIKKKISSLMLVAVKLATNYEKISRRGTATILLSKHISCKAIDKLFNGTNKMCPDL
jgi:hypothetical protein